ncbi:MAG: response regulator transcription factor [Cyanothece sp. SIO1E1]|nr:response regulator transcription factor [Cyanothece sp. SIO1E1]
MMANQGLCKLLVVDDHETTLSGTVAMLQQQYPQATILKAKTVQGVFEQLSNPLPELIVLDLSIPEKSGEYAQTEVGIRLLRKLMRDYPKLNFTVQSTYVNALVRVMPEISIHLGGFTIADKSLASEEMLARIEWACQGLTHTKDLRIGQPGFEVRSEWLEVMRLAFQEGLQDKAIAKQMNVSERTIRIYWTKIRDVLELYPDAEEENDKNPRIRTEIRARREGLID